MYKNYLLMMLCVTVLTTGCTQPPPPPSLTQAEVSALLKETEARLSTQLSQQCDNTLDSRLTNQQQQQLTALEEIQNFQQQLQQQIVSIESKLNQVHPAPTSSISEPPPSVVVDGQTLGNKMVLGELEWLWVEAVNGIFQARIDTGATTSSIGADDIIVFERDGQSWVKFNLLPDEDVNLYPVEAPLTRYVRIRQSSTDELDRRPVVKLTVKVGNLTEETEFTLTDRAHMKYPILLGRAFLQDIAVVDVAQKHIQPKPKIKVELDTDASGN